MESNGVKISNELYSILVNLGNSTYSLKEAIREVSRVAHLKEDNSKNKIKMDKKNDVYDILLELGKDNITVEEAIQQVTELDKRRKKYLKN